MSHSSGLADKVRANKVREDWRRRDPWSIRVLAVAVAGGLALAVAAFVARDASTDPPGAQALANAAAAAAAGVPPPPVAGRPQAEPAIRGVDVHVDERAGYLVSFPADWRFAEGAATDQLVDPTGRSVLTFGEAPSGPLPGAADDAIDALAPPDASVAIATRTAERTEQGQRGLVVGGTATEPDGTSLQLVAIAIEGATGTYTITARFPSTVDDAFVADLEQIIGSFRTTDPGV